LLEGADLLGRKPPTVVLLGIVPSSIELGFGLSPEVEHALPALVELLKKETASLGFVFAEAP
jgi:Ni,Fe-hydrogenase maturation factor